MTEDTKKIPNINLKPWPLARPKRMQSYMNYDAFLGFGSKSGWIEVEEMKKYWHEAGHAVVARITGFPVRWVSTDTRFISKSSLAKENEANNSEAVCMTISSDQINPIFRKHAALNKRDKETLIGYAMHVLAGPFFEHRFAPAYFSPSASMNDYGQVNFVLTSAQPKKVARENLIRTAQRRLKTLPQRDLDAVARVAFALYPSNTIYADEIDTIIAELEQKEAA